ncbi:hypothetical protein [Halorubrum sp. AS12]|uniref:hypothetical protein n=1 Tax=Halorubrum sp. AS12 TaxID=3409687 RepID=UPI003DA6E71B
MCHHYDEARTWTEIQARHRPEEADERDAAPDVDELPDVDAVDKPAGETEETEPPAEPRAPADD